MPIKVKSISELKKTVCAVPWMHLAFEPNGRVIPCCLTSTHLDAAVGDLNIQSIDKIWNSNNMKKLRKEMINGVKPTICSKCFNREQVTNESGRVYHNRDFPDVIKQIPFITEEDGTCTEMKLHYWDFRFSNLCNYKCRSCGPAYSSAWVPDAKKLGWITEQDKVSNIDGVNDLSNFDFLKEQVKHVEKIYFAGGEPLLMPEHWQTLDLLVAHKRFDVKISYNTNCSTLTYGGKNVLDYWRQWDAGKIEVWPSIDEIDDRAELIRSGTVWDKVETNLKELTKLDNITLRPGLTIGAWNVHRLPEIITRLVDIGVIHSRPQNGACYDNFFINLLEQPVHYHVSILPDSFRQETIDKLQLFIKEYETKYHTRIENRFTHIIHELTKPFNLSAANEFIKMTRKLDAARVENTYITIPEMNKVKQAVLSPEPVKKVFKVIPIVPASSISSLAKPVVYNSTNIVEIKNTPNSLMLTWLLNNICTNHCSYCPDEVHNGTNHHYEWYHAKNFINACFSKFDNVHCSISGGEPTVSPFFKDLINLIYDRGGSMHLTTNLVRPKHYWEDIANKFSSIATSYHPEFVLTDKQESEFIDKINFISNYTSVTVRVMMLPTQWNQCLKFYNRLVENNSAGYGIEMVRILPNFGVGENYCNIEYTPEQNAILNSTPVTAATIDVLSIEDYRVKMHTSYIKSDTGETTVLDHVVQSSLESKKLANFNHWSCDIGLESVFVNFDGDIKRGNCGVGGVLGNIARLEEIKSWPTDSVICNKNECHCTADLIISKRVV